MACPQCGHRILPVGEGIYKCQFCGTYLKDKNGVLVPYSHTVTPYTRTLRERLRSEDRVPERVEREVVVEEAGPDVPFGESLDKDMVVFIRRTAEALTPITGYEHDEAFKRSAFRVRDTFIRELTDCFTGKRDFDEWFDSTKTSLGKHPSEMTQIMVDALEGLKNPEAVQMRNGLIAALQRTPY